MNHLLITVLNMSIAAGIAAIAVMLVRILLKNAPKLFSYSLWAVVFLRLICPFSFESAASFMPVNRELIPPATVTDGNPQINSGLTAIDSTVNRLLGHPTPESGDAPNVPDADRAILPLQAALTGAAYVWLFGTAVILVYSAAAYIRLKRRIYDATLLYDNIFETDKISTAFVLGLIHPRIYVPSELRQEQLDCVLAHERVHIRRRDYVFKFLAFLALTVHWFNPLVWVSYRLMSEDMEMSCDEAVLRTADSDIRRIYSTSLVSLYARKRELLNPLAFGGGSIRYMKERIKNVLNFKKTSRMAAAAYTLAAALFTAGFVTSPVSAALPPAPGNPSGNIFLENQARNPGTADNTALPLEKLKPGEDMKQASSNYNSRTDSLIENFRQYASYGVTYDPEQDAVYYNGRRVKLFVSFQDHGNEKNSYFFDLCYHDRGTDSMLYLEAVRDQNGNLTGIRELDKTIADELLDNMEDITPGWDKKRWDKKGWEKEDTGYPGRPGDGIPYITMDGTQILDAAGIRGSDIGKDSVGENVKDWIQQCDKNQGAYLMKIPSSHGNTVYVYYNGGGRYPWSMETDNGDSRKITVNMYSESDLVTKDGYFLMRLTTTEDDPEISLYLDGIEIEFR